MWELGVLKSRKKLILITILVIVLIGAAGFIYYVSDYYPADSYALAALNSTESYTVSNTPDFITFTPNTPKNSTGIIIYPGGKVQAESYSIIASKLAENGYITVIVRMPFNLAFFGSEKANTVIANHPEISSWVMVGHSLGGVFASDYAVNHPEKIRGVIYLASYPSANASNATFKALSLRGSRDNLTQPEDISKNLDKFPKNTLFTTIEGGNHYNFGNYGTQSGDNNSTITREEQQNQTLKAILEFLKTL
ncbi:alpha/beta hydrolase [Methanobacterium formicicum]|uniref:alpha/beta hydrolase n=1 Tax=Methanobacterium formicicum TaxID=2162 RepID=UPI0024122B28|nr:MULTISPECIES: alpha/beta hydrolase [Methanobacterium]MDG3546489.1 alpha/beta hydrolase [Methanobacterium formicicum]MDH2658405.1 alpha/beta hydrolase [Methanobacterium formicicum]